MNINLLDPVSYFELSQRYEYLNFAYIFEVILSKIDSPQEAVAFLSFHLKEYLKKGNYFFDLKDYDPICDFLPPSTMPEHQVSTTLKAIIAAKTALKDEVKKELERIGVNRLAPEKVIGFSLLKSEHIKILESGSNLKTEITNQEKENVSIRLKQALKLFIAVSYGEDVACKIRSNIAENDTTQGVKYSDGAIQKAFDKKGYKVPFSGRYLADMLKDVDISEFKTN
ncbi:hypothetical protein [Haemophilus haemolyticus]|uniref:hypothetical protein n=1 Tax=Haemophilus haemolyticus TaxID=726 RepID=UPI00112A7A40|nr:hypothetical protein [Haemophilus haemolyticus]TPH25384.1 hypothetical protein EUX56_06730 [Haemophilus haemolyticus]